MAIFFVHPYLLISVRTSIFSFSTIPPMLRKRLCLKITITSGKNRRSLGTLKMLFCI